MMNDDTEAFHEFLGSCGISEDELIRMFDRSGADDPMYKLKDVCGMRGNYSENFKPFVDKHDRRRRNRNKSRRNR